MARRSEPQSHCTTKQREEASTNMQTALRRVRVRFDPSYVRNVCATKPGAVSLSQQQQQLLADEQIRSVLQSAQLDEHANVIDNQTRLALLSRFTHLSGRPVRSNALAEMNSAMDMANWFAIEMTPDYVPLHAKKMMLGAHNAPAHDNAPQLNRMRVTCEQVRDTMQEQLPPNLKLDPATFQSSAPPPFSTGGGKMRRYKRHPRVNEPQHTQ